MKKFMKSYKSSIILIMAVIIGTIIGLIFKEKASVLSPLGDIFINMLLVVVVPLIFLSYAISTSQASLKAALSYDNPSGRILEMQ